MRHLISRYLPPLWELLPSHCFLCLTPSTSAFPLCTQCTTSLPWNGHCCQVCALPLLTYAPARDLYCGRCLARGFAFRKAIAPFRYEGDIALLIQRFKYSANLRAGHILGTLITPYVDFCDLMIPVPQHPTRARQRGFDHTLWLARHLGCPLGQALRIKHTPTLRGATRRQRKRYVKGAFQLQTDVVHRQVTLLDDVMTTAATLNELAMLCRRHGAHDVRVLTIARTPVSAWSKSTPSG